MQILTFIKTTFAINLRMILVHFQGIPSHTLVKIKVILEKTNYGESKERNQWIPEVWGDGRINKLSTEDL